MSNLSELAKKQAEYWKEVRPYFQNNQDVYMITMNRERYDGMIELFMALAEMGKHDAG